MRRSAKVHFVHESIFWVCTVDALTFPTLLTAFSAMALLAYAVAAFATERVPGGLRLYLLVGWVLHAVSIAI